MTPLTGLGWGLCNLVRIWWGSPALFLVSVLVLPWSHGSGTESRPKKGRGHSAHSLGFQRLPTSGLWTTSCPREKSDGGLPRSRGVESKTTIWNLSPAHSFNGRWTGSPCWKMVRHWRHARTVPQPQMGAHNRQKISPCWAQSQHNPSGVLTMLCLGGTQQARRMWMWHFWAVIQRQSRWTSISPLRWFLGAVKGWYLLQRWHKAVLCYPKEKERFCTLSRPQNKILWNQSQKYK